MPNLSRKIALVMLTLALPCGASASSEEGSRSYSPADHPPPAPAPTPALRALGERVYKGACTGCHGEHGDGAGREGKLLSIPPRDFTRGSFSFRSTPGGTLPTDADLFRAVRRGFRRDVGMPPFPYLSDREVYAVADYVKTFSARWKTDKAPAPLVVPPPPKRTSSMIEQGAALYKQMGCPGCHGAAGQGDGPASRAFRYPNGKPLPPANFTLPANLKGGSAPADIYRTISTGVDGTPMAAFGAGLPPEKRWQLVYYIVAFGEGGASK